MIESPDSIEIDPDRRSRRSERADGDAVSMKRGATRIEFDPSGCARGKKPCLTQRARSNALTGTNALPPLSYPTEVPMAGVIAASPAGPRGRRSLDSELNMIPMIDLLMVTISFLLITAVWTNMARIDADAQVPGAEGAAPAGVETRLHLELGDPARIVLHWNAGPGVVRSVEIPRREEVTVERGVRKVSFEGLGAKLAEEWEAAGTHRATTDARFDELVLHTADDASYAEIVSAMDAAYGVKRPCARGKACSAFRVVFASR
jgi:biopolymer transport protein ExbD